MPFHKRSFILPDWVVARHMLVAVWGVIIPGTLKASCFSLNTTLNGTMQMCVYEREEAVYTQENACAMPVQAISLVIMTRAIISRGITLYVQLWQHHKAAIKEEQLKIGRLKERETVGLLNMFWKGGHVSSSGVQESLLLMSLFLSSNCICIFVSAI